MLATGRWGVMSGLQIYRAILADIRQMNYDVLASMRIQLDHKKFGC
jgi:hypothetical protein